MRVPPNFPGFQVSGGLVSKSLTLQGRESGQRRAVGSREQEQHEQVLRKLVVVVLFFFFSFFSFFFFLPL